MPSVFGLFLMAALPFSRAHLILLSLKKSTHAKSLNGMIWIQECLTTLPQNSIQVHTPVPFSLCSHAIETFSATGK